MDFPRLTPLYFQELGETPGEVVVRGLTRPQDVARLMVTPRKLGMTALLLAPLGFSCLRGCLSLLDDFQSDGAGELREFLEHALGRRAAGVGLDQQRVFAPAGAFEQLGRHCRSDAGGGRRIQACRAEHPVQSRDPQTQASSPASSSASVPVGPTRTLRAGTTVEIACL